MNFTLDEVDHLEVARAQREHPADMNFSLDEVDRLEVARAQREHPADMNFSLDEVHQASAAASGGGLPPADMTFTLDEVDAINARSHAGHGGGHEGGEGGEGGGHEGGAEHEGAGEEILEGVHTGHALGDIGHVGMEIAHIAEEEREVAEAARAGVTLGEAASELSTLGTVTNGLGAALGPIGTVMGGYQLGEGIRDNNLTDIIGGGLGITSGTVGTAASVTALAGGSAPLLAEAAPVIGAGAAGWGAGRLIDEHINDGIQAVGVDNALTAAEVLVPGTGPLLQAGRDAGVFDAEREEVGRGMDGGTHRVEDDRAMTDRVTSAVAGVPTGPVSDQQLDDAYARGSLGRAMATHLPTLLGGDQDNLTYNPVIEATSMVMGLFQ
ncbi:MAG: hypothetical protein H6708_33605 [Kofleriaceae bacterium]|nr:hypothetical protein [Myxococcales bacterium]MCB9565349.1 hypothetical protein [Kofleriaceae bacterium]